MRHTNSRISIIQFSSREFRHFKFLFYNEVSQYAKYENMKYEFFFDEDCGVVCVFKSSNPTFTITLQQFITSNRIDICPWYDIGMMRMYRVMIGLGKRTFALSLLLVFTGENICKHTDKIEHLFLWINFGNTGNWHQWCPKPDILHINLEQWNSIPKLFDALT